MEYHNYVIAKERKNIYLKFGNCFSFNNIAVTKKIKLLLKTIKDYTITEKMTIFDE